MIYSIGIKEVMIPDADPSFPMWVTYPTDVPFKERTKIGHYQSQATLNAPLKNEPFPLVIFSHGSGASNLGHLTLAEYLSRHGYVVGMPEHPGNNRFDNSRTGTVQNLEDRPKHISLAINQIFTHWNKIENRVAIVGHSIGGYTALALAGGKPYTETAEPISVEPDERIKTLVLLAPAAGWFNKEGALAKVQTPILIYSGEHDTVTPLHNAEIIKLGINRSVFVEHLIVKRGDHFSFLSPFPEPFVQAHFPPAMDPEGFDRAKFQEVEMNETILAFLNNYFLG